MSVIYSAYATILAFIGGTLWPLGLEISGGPETGLLFIFVISPIILGVFFLITMIVVTPILLLRRKR